MRIRKLYILIALIAAGLTVQAFLASPASAEVYDPQGIATSTNLLAGSSASSITNFYYNLASLPGDSRVTIQFSQDNSAWYSAAGTLNASTSLSTTGGADLSLSALSWSGSSFYYRMYLFSTGDLSGTPEIDEIRLDYDPAAGYENVFVFDNTGNVGIGNSTPSSLLTVGATAGSQFLVNNIGQVTGGTWQGSPIGIAYGGTNWNSTGSSGIAVLSNGAWSASTTLSINAGGTGLQTHPSNGQILLGNISGGYTLSATSSLNINLANISGTLGVPMGGTGSTTLSGILKGNGTGAIASITGTAGYITYWTDNTTIGASSTLANNLGGTGQNSSGWTGIPVVNSGIWSSSSTLSVYRGGTGISSYALGDMLYASSSGALVKSPIGSFGNVLMVNNGIPSWTATSSLNISGGTGGVGAATLAGQMAYYASAGSNVSATSSIFINTLGYVGIGTTSPLAGLSLQGTAGQPILNIASSTGASLMYVDQNGNVGIGTNNPADKLYISDGTGIQTEIAVVRSISGSSALLLAGLRTSDNVVAGVRFANSVNELARIESYRTGANDAGDLRFSTKATGESLTEYMRISATGNIGIGTTSPLAKLSIQGTAGDSNIFQVASSTRANLFTINKDGNVGIGITAPTNKLSIYGSAVNADLNFMDSNTNVFTMGVDYLDQGKFKISNSASLGTMDMFTIVPASIATAYSNPGGTGERTGSITATSTVGLFQDGNATYLVNGSYSDQVSFTNVLSVAGKYIKFDFGEGSSKIITEAKWYQAAGFPHGTWKWQGSNNDTDWTDIGGNFVIDTTAVQTITTLSANTSGYRYYRMLGVSGDTDMGYLEQEIEFKIADYVGASKVGIANSQPLARFDIKGGGTGTDFTFRTQDSTGANRFVIQDNGIVGIGTTTPDAKLTVWGTSGQAILNIASSSNSSLLYINSNGNVGIGTTNPAATLHVSGSTMILGQGEGGTPSAFTIRGSAASGNNINGANMTFDASNGTGSGGSGSLIFRTAPPAGTVITLESTTHGYHAWGGGTLSWSHTISASNSNKLLIVGVAKANSSTISSVTYGGVGLTLLGSIKGNVWSERDIVIYYLKDATLPTGTNTIVVTFSGSEAAIGIAHSYYNVNQSATFGTVATNYHDGGCCTTSVTPTVDVSSVAGDKVVDFIASAVSWGTPVPGAGQTMTYHEEQSDQKAASSWELATAGTTTMSWTVDPITNWLSIGVALKSMTNSDPNEMADRLHINNTGAIGIGTANPLARLDISPTITATADFKVMNSGLVYNGATAMNNYYSYYISAPTGAGTITNKYALVTEAGAGNVGIGTTSPLAKLDIWGASGQPVLNIASSTGTSLMYINQNGNVGIGTSSPNSLLTVGATAGSQFLVNTSGTITQGVWNGTAIGAQYGGTGSTTLSGILKGNGTGEVLTAVAGTDYLTGSNIGNGTAGWIPYYTGSNNTLTATSSIYLKSDGNIGIGTTSPIYKLALAGNMGITGVPTGYGISQGALYINSASTTDNYTLIGAAINGFDRFKVDEDGDIVALGNISLAGDKIKTVSIVRDVVGSSNNVESTNSTGLMTSIASGAEGYPRLAYYYYTGATIYFSQCTTANCSSRNTNSIWTCANQSTNPVVSMALDSSGYARMSYYRGYNTNIGLGYAQCTNADCSSKENNALDEFTAYTGRFNAMALDSNNHARIAYEYYINSSYSNLKYIQCTNDDCSITSSSTIDTGGILGKYVAIDLDSNDYANISYYNQSQGYLKYARCYNADCTSTSTINIDTANDTGQYTSLAMDNNDFARISYYDVSNQQLKYIKCNNTDCSSRDTETVDTDGNVGQYSALKLDADDYPHISYYDVTNGNLKYAYKDGGGWHVSTIDSSANDVGKYSSLALTSDSYKVAYFDETNDDLFLYSAGTQENTNQLQITANPVGSEITQGLLYLNPASANPGSTLLGIALNGAQRFRVDESGNTEIAGKVGIGYTGAFNGALAVNGSASIGTTTPSAKLTVWGSGTGTGVIFNLVNSSSSTLMTVLDNGNVGIGTSSLLAKLTVQGTARQPILNIASSTGASLLYLDRYGNLGIGTTTPDYQLHLNNNQNSGTLMGISNYNSGTLASAGLSMANSAGATNIVSIFVGGTGFTLAGVAPSWQDSAVISAASGLSGGIKIRAATGGIKFSSSAIEASDMYIDTSGNVGIGTSSPLSKLTVQGTAGQSPLNITSSTGAPLLNISTTSNIGIGTLPDYKLHVLENRTDTVSGDNIMVYNKLKLNNGSVSAGDYYANYNALYVYGNTVGGATASRGFTYYGETANQSYLAGVEGMTYIENTAGTVNNAYGIIGDVTKGSGAGDLDEAYGVSGQIANQSSADIWGAYGLISEVTNTGGGVITNGYGLYINAIAGTNNWGVYQSSSTNKNYFAGNVGIGTTSPNALLHLFKAGATSADTMFSISTSSTGIGFKITGDGKAYSDYGFVSTGADYAEYFYSVDTDLANGEVVCIDVTRNNAVKRCGRVADENVMGIVSSNPAMVGNHSASYENNHYYHIIAMLGQIPAFVSDENGSIRPGDSLTSATKPGYAMRADAGDSTVGVALEPLASGEGKIKVLISRRNKSLTVEQVEDQVTDRIAAMNIEDEVNIMVAKAIETLDLSVQVKEIIAPDLALLSSKLTAAMDAMSGQIIDTKNQLSAMNGDLLKMQGDLVSISNSQFLISNEIQNFNSLVTNNQLQITNLSDRLATLENYFTLDGNGNIVLKESTSPQPSPSKGEGVDAATSTLTQGEEAGVATSTLAQVLGDTVPSPYEGEGQGEVMIVGITSSTSQTALVVNQVGDPSTSSGLADFRYNNVSIMNIDNTGKVAIVGELLVDGRIMVCSGGACDASLDSSVDQTNGDMGVEGKVVAGAFENYCPEGYLWIPGSAKYGTMPGFCVMGGKAMKDPTGLPATSPCKGEVNTASVWWIDISQGEAVEACKSLGKGYHLLSENEWLTMAENIVSTDLTQILDTQINTDLGQILGIQISTDLGQINTNLETSTATTAGYKLSTGMRIYGLSSKYGEWTNEIINKQDNIEPVSNDWNEFSDITSYKDLRQIRPPYYLSSADGIGKILTGDNDNKLRGFVRGLNGIYSLDLSHAPTEATSTIGFRCAK